VKPEARLVMTRTDYLELIPAAASKGVALRHLCEHLDVPLGRTIAVGDQENDLEMIEAAGLGWRCRRRRSGSGPPPAGWRRPPGTAACSRCFASSCRNDSPDACRARVLIVDDEPEIGRILGVILRGAGFEVAAVDGGPGRPRAPRRFRHDLVLLDVNHAGAGRLRDPASHPGGSGHRETARC